MNRCAFFKGMGYRQLSVDITMKNYKNKVRDKKNKFYFNIRGKLYGIRRYVLYMIFQYGYDRTGSNPQDINRFGSNSGRKPIFIQNYQNIYL